MATFYWSILIIVVTGAFGGFVHGVLLQPRMKYVVVTPFYHDIELGVIGDMLIGIAAGISIFFLMDSLFGLTPEALTKGDQLLRLVALGVICGYMGSSVLNSLGMTISTRFVKAQGELQEELKKAQDRAKSASRAGHLISLASAYGRWGMFAEALSICTEAIESDPTIADYYIAKSFIYAAEAQTINNPSDPHRDELYKDAISMTNKAIKVDGLSARAHYDRACYNNMMHKNREEVIADLGRSFELDPMMRRLAKYDPDLKSLKDYDEFKKLVEPIANAIKAS